MYAFLLITLGNFTIIVKLLHIYYIGFANCVDRMQKIDYNRIYVYRKFFNSQ